MKEESDKTMRKSEVWLRAVLDASIDGIRRVDKELRIIWANKTTTSARDMPSEAVVGQKCQTGAKSDRHWKRLPPWTQVLFLPISEKPP